MSESSDIIESSLELRRKLFHILKEHISNEKISSNKDRFKIIGIVFSSLLAQVVHAMFQKDIGLDPHFSYIDSVCEMAKKQLEEGAFHIGVGIQ